MDMEPTAHDIMQMQRMQQDENLQMEITGRETPPQNTLQNTPNNDPRVTPEAQSESFLKSGLGAVGEFGLGAKDAAYNFALKTAKGATELGNYTSGKLVEGVNKVLPFDLQHPRGEIPLNEMPNREGEAYQLGKFVGDIGSIFAGGAALNGGRAILAEEAGIPFISQLLERMGGKGTAEGVARRVSGAGAAAALMNPDNPMQAGMDEAQLAAMLEVLVPGIGTGIKKTGGFFTGQNAVDKALKGIHPYYEELKKSVSEKYYKPVTEGHFQNYHIDRANINRTFTNMQPQTVNKFDGETKRLVADFLQKPTLKEAHNVQSQIASDIRDLKGPNIDYVTRKKINWLESQRSNLLAQMDSFMRPRNKDLAEGYKIGAEQWAKNVKPFEANKILRNIAKGTKEKSIPPELIRAIKTAKESGQIGEEHYLSKILEKVENAKNLGKGAKNVLGAAGVLAGSMYGPMGALAGGSIGKAIIPGIFDVASNPALVKLLQKNYPYIAKGIIGSDLE